MDAGRRPAGPLSSLFAGSEAAKVIDFLLSKKDQHQTISEIHAGTRASLDMINKIIGNLLDIDAVGIGARRVDGLGNEDKSKDENTYYIRDDTDTGKSIKDLWYHLMQVQTKNFI
ncbi:hypothetical protein NTE_01153 [Candidatus Nitrososphaera evergladensis SR1]|uniref:Uncharacterized protein n=1 Tax=Candidatus Nitrososphaera evergladensis SR1 TaxID=1459636 RepID=A0A075MNX6_9ARCH|nr:hypothetical protein [Candidatus Nitrososphaera evergladensis]AIF83226.1 hypothetical protein NTE_01153 [Candidatus Nitrososphaera evergladensis SR1]